MKYRKRRQRVGFAATVSLVVLILGGLIFFSVNPNEPLATEQRAGGEELVQRPETPATAEAPEAAASAEEGNAAGEEVPTEPSSGEEASEENDSGEPEIVEAPDVPYNATEEEARKFLEERGFELGEVKREPNDEYEKGGVFFQAPLPGEDVEEGGEVGITLSDGPEEKKSADDGDIPDPGATDLYLTVPKMGLSGDYVANAADEGTLMNGAGKITETGFPWQESANTYISSHVFGYEGTGSWQHFAALPNMTYGDEVILADANGTEYTYEVSNIMTVAPTETWVTEPVAGKDMVSLQTCVGPGWSERMVVQAERVDVNVAA